MKIIIFTNKTSLGEVNSNLVSQTTDDGTTNSDFGNLIERNIIVVRKGKEWSNADFNNFTSNLILIKDDFCNTVETFNIFNTWYNTIKKEEHYVIYHNEPSFINFEEYKKTASWKLGHHISGFNGNYYPEIADVLLGANGETDIQLVEEIDEKLNLSKAKLEKKKQDFLYSIYNGDNLVLKCLPDFVKHLNCDLEESIKFLSERNYKIDLDMGDDETQGAEQRTHLRILRDALLN